MRAGVKVAKRYRTRGITEPWVMAGVVLSVWLCWMVWVVGR